MSYEPTLLIKRQDLLKIEDELYEESFSHNKDVARIATFLTVELRGEYIEFEDKEIIVAMPELTGFNALVRERLDQAQVYYKTHW